MRCQRDINRIRHEVFLKQHNCWSDENYIVVAAKTTRTVTSSLQDMANETSWFSKTQDNSRHYEDDKPLESAQNLGHILCTITITPIFIAIARLLLRSFASKPGTHWIWIRYIAEFIVITVPVVMSVNYLNDYVEWFVLIVLLVFLKILSSCSFYDQLEMRQFECSQRPALLTLLRSNISYLTALCILAVDFTNFPSEFRKTRRYGTGLMDVGIGLFVAAMGLVSNRPNKFQDIRKMLIVVTWLIALGFGRTISLSVINYHQDEHEYGVHLNAFFTLAFTKFLGTLISGLVCTDLVLLPLGILLLIIHEAILQYGLADYVMSSNVKRISFIASNREGIFSVPGFVVIYILSMFLGKSLRLKSNTTTNFLWKLRYLALTAAVSWSLLICSNFVTGIARVTCNIGYVLWILALVVTMSCVYIIFFDLVLDTLWPQNSKITNSPIPDSRLPLLVEAVNYNGLVFFILANLLTGAVNMFMSPDTKNDLETIFILTCYMFLCTTVTFILYRQQIRIA